ncbi:N-acetylneuraminate synthase [Paenibacillus uliginis N3/975]|uniref:N-acetylneuraminate synthase n=1 Tax=Paenibacillus uliginis N3/975 TaxID=1313296 RepID=A0A1X7GC11_9BACL|nr:N-acetylneuraminate synthase [Paenibacillus uliginis]SMF67511.1 N-acetylneuraminate synthase [Paenibacillus uliginis N3/975]
MSEPRFGKDGHGVYIIAEIGVNHNGSLQRAKECIDQAVACGADAVKFQTFKSEKLVTKQAVKAEYQTEHTDASESQLDMLRQLELSFEQFLTLKQYCEEKNIDFLSTPFDEESAGFLNSIEVDAFKIGSGDMNNLPLLAYIDQFERPVILSTGMADLEEVEESLNVFTKSSVALLHCTSDYPAPLEDVNLLAMNTMADRFKTMTGYSDHTDGIEIAVAAVARGARIIEKHFTVDRSLPGPDHMASLEPYDFKRMVQGIRNVERALGDGVKRCMPSEENTKIVARKSIVINCSKSAGEVLTENDLAIKRPGTGIEPKYYFDLIGRQLLNDVEADQLLQWSDLK